LTAPPTPRWTRIVIVLTVAFFIVFRAVGVDPFGPLDRRLYDLVLVPLLPSPPVSDRIAIVAVDDRSLIEGGERWPLSRSTWAAFIKRLDALGTSNIVLDVVFDQDTQNDVRRLAELVRQRAVLANPDSHGAMPRLLELVDDAARELDGDLALAQSLAEAGNVTVGMMLTDRRPDPFAAPLVLESVDSQLGLAPHDDPVRLELTTLIASTPRLFLSARSHGTMNVLLDEDGTVRRYPLVTGYDGRHLASLALAARIADLAPSESLPIIKRALAADDAAPLLRYRDADQPFPMVSFSDVLTLGEGSSLERMLRGKVVFVGTTAAGVEDLLRTPKQPRLAGVEVHATALENLYFNSWIESGGTANWVSIVSCLALVGCMAIIIGRRFKARYLWVAGLGLMVLHFATAVVVADGAGWLLALSPTPIGIVALGTAEAGYRWLWSRREQVRLGERERILEAERVALERFRSVVEHVADAIVSVDEAQRIRWMNPAAESLFQRRARTAVDRPVGELIARVKGDTTLGEVLAAEARVGSEMVPVEATATQMRVGGERYTNFVFRDVAARKALERQKDDFIASINHELRTPITSILGSLRLVVGGAMGDVSDKVKELLGIAEKNGERLLTLVTDLLDAAKLDAGRLSLERKPVPLTAFVEEAIERCRGFGSRYGVEIKFAPADPTCADAVIAIDRERMIQVVGNLVSNAVKHSPTNAPVIVATRVAHGFARILVSDSGPGIPAEYHDQLFERFVMTTAGDGKRRPGTGLGLAIAKGLVESHGGRIGFSSEVGHGTTFWFELPTLA
jgi:PAS domain S-box-containing protein